MSGTDWRGLCEELASWIERATRHCFQGPEVLDRARAALAQPEPEVVGPTYDDLSQLCAEHGLDADSWPTEEFDALWEVSRAILSRWGNHPAKPNSSIDGPAVHEGREPASVVGEPNDEELYDYWISTSPEFGCADPVGFARAVLARWGSSCQGILDSSASSAPTGEVEELVRWLRMQGEAQKPGPNSLLSDRTRSERHAAGTKLTRAADLLERQAVPVPLPGEEAAELALKELERTVILLMPVTGHKKIKRFDTIRAALKRLQELENKADSNPAQVPVEVANPWKDVLIDALVCSFLLNKENASDPKKALHDIISWEIELSKDPSINPSLQPAPVAVSERLPQPEDCDADGNCWWYDSDWFWDDRQPMGTTHWLPAHALPLPSGEVEA